MREHSPFDRSPISRDRARTRSQDVEQPITETPKQKTATESPVVIQKKAEDAREQAEQFASDLKQTQTEPVAPEPMPILAAKQSFIDRVRNFFGIPKSISSEIKQLEKSDVQAVEAFNADEKKSPKIIRKPSKLSHALLFGTALGAIGLTHEPQIEQVAQKGIEVAKEFEKTTEAALIKFKSEIVAFIERNKPFGKEAFAGELNIHSDGTEEGETDETSSYTKSQKNKLEKFSKGNRVKLSKEQETQAVQLIEAVENGFETYREFFLNMEFIHGQITEEERDEARSMLQQISLDVREKLTEEERKSSIRVAFELAKHRETYAREKADLYSMAMSKQGNCEALVRFLLAEVPSVADNRHEMAVQVFSDHVRFLVRDNDEQPWEWIDGQSHGVLTKEEMQGTLIVDPREMMKESVGLVDRVQKKKAGDPIPEKNMGYTTNSMLRWETKDGRTPARAASPDGEVPLRVDESKNKNKTFEQGAHTPKKERTRYIEVSPEFFQNGNVEMEQEKDAQEAEAKEIRLAPKEKHLDKILQDGTVFGYYNDLTPLEGINIYSVNLQDPKDDNELAARDIDLSPLKNSDLHDIFIHDMLSIKGVDSLNVKKIKVANLSLTHETLWNKIAKESESLQELKLYVPVYSPEKHAQLMKTGEILRMPGFEDMIKKLQKQKSGSFILRTSYPFEENAPLAEWIFDGTIGSWSANIEKIDSVSLELRESLNQNKKDPSILSIPASVSSLEYIHQEQVNLEKLKTLSIDNPSLEVSSGHEGDGDTIDLDLSVLQEAKKLNKIQLNIPYISTSRLNLSALENLSFKELVIYTNSNPSEFTVEGIDSKRIRISILPITQ